MQGSPLTIFYSYLIEKENADRIIAINTFQFEEATKNTDSLLSSARQLALITSLDFKVRRAAKLDNLDSTENKVIAIAAYESITNFLSASRIADYVERFLIFNESGMNFAAGTAKVMGSTDDGAKAFKKLQSGTIGEVFTVSENLNNSKKVIILCLPIVEDKKAYLYLELSLSLLSPINSLNNDYLSTGLLLKDDTKINLTDSAIEKNDSIFSRDRKLQIDKQDYLQASHSAIFSDFYYVSLLNYTQLTHSRSNVFYNMFYIAFFILLVSSLLALMLSKRITRPVNGIIEQIKKLKNNQLVPNLEIEKGKDEFAQIGKTLNEMTCEMTHLIKEKELLFEEKKRDEITLLQSQVNPHFLYNTLESIRWMAVIQKNVGIEKMARSLSFLLKNLSKGTDDIISLAEECTILEDYVAIQKIRYLDSFEFINNIPPELLNCKIVKFTLQPIVENAIIHGIDTTKFGGIIVLDAKADDEFITIIVADNGKGMEENLFTDLKKNKLTGIGIKNVDKRLRLIFDERCGIRIESELKKGTKVFIKLLRREDV